MKKFCSLLKAMLSQDMNMFSYSAKSNSSKLTKILLPLIIAVVFMTAVGSYCYMIAEPLAPMGLTFVMLTLFIIIVSVLTFMEGLYKSQGILFDCKDNDLLFSLPIKKLSVFALRILKLLIFQFTYNLVIMLPSIAIYVYFEKPGVSFYLVTLLMLILLPILPTVVSSILGYIVKGVSSKFKAKKIMQTLLSLVLFLGIFFLSFNFEGMISGLVENATSINEVLTKVYYPAGAYINLIQEFNSVELLKLIAINIVPLMITIYIGSIFYFKIISKSSEKGIKRTVNKQKNKIKVTKPVNALVKKELKRYFSSPVYMLNTLFGVCIIFIATIALCINSNSLIETVTTNAEMGVNIDQIYEYLPKIFMQLIIFVGCMTSITSCSISLEGKSFNITKSLPVKTEKILLSKILACTLITIPVILISDLIFAIKFNTNLTDTVLMLAFTIATPILTSLIGLIINLKYPKMEWTTETEVVKQSMSPMISVWIGMLIFAASTALMINFLNDANTFFIMEMCVFIIADILLWQILKKYGKKQFKKINV